MGSLANANPMPDFVLIEKPDTVKRLMVKAAIVKEKEITAFENKLNEFYKINGVSRNNIFECGYFSLKEQLKMEQDLGWFLKGYYWNFQKFYS